MQCTWYACLKVAVVMRYDAKAYVNVIYIKFKHIINIVPSLEIRKYYRRAVILNFVLNFE